MSSVRQTAQFQVESAIAGLADSSIALELFAVANLLAGEKTLLRTLGDSGVAVDARQATIAGLLDGKVSSQTLAVVNTVVGARWSKTDELVAAIENAGATIVLADAEKQGVISRVEEEIFYFGRLIDSESALQMALTNPASTPQSKSQLVTDLLSGQAHAATVALISQVVSHSRGRRLGTSIDELSALSAKRRSSVVATVTVARTLSATQKDRLVTVLGRIYGTQVLVDEVVDTSVVGGIAVDVSGEVIDGTIATRIEQARRQLQA